MTRKAEKTEVVGAVAPTTAQPEQTSEIAVATQQEPTSTTEEMYKVVVCAYKGTEDLVAKAWGKMYDKPVLIVSVDEGGDDVRGIATELIANNQVCDQFVLVKPNTIPCARITDAELSLPLVYVDKAGEQHFSHRLPMPFDKNNLVDAFGSDDYPANDENDENFLRSYAERFLTRPIQVSHNFGNYVTIVLRGNPCNAVIAEGISRRKFICANAVGFKAVEPFVEALLSK